MPIGCSDHNLIVVVRNIKVDRPGPSVVFKTSYKLFNRDEFVNDVKKISWSEIISMNNPETALLKLNKLKMPLVEKHAPMRKSNVRNTTTPWLNKEIKDYMKMRDQLKKTALITGNKCDWDLYRKMRNSVTKLNRKKRKIYFDNQFHKVGNDSKKIWKVLNKLTGRKNKDNPLFLEAGDKFITKPVEIANYLNDYFISKLDKLKENMPNLSDDISHLLIRNEIMKRKC